ncbi:hypothetical protein MYP_2832 [Sporocytophaga myxococcoides]|uniref:Uncharacterized protein n=1 Tax=Sporocytophaga myxococcoides TaxID=153721 RepID=A0A098LGL7_9BACT|nr:hypothetical protein MYP_2832 [Sporocytophaga myxococcoides]
MFTLGTPVINKVIKAMPIKTIKGIIDNFRVIWLIFCVTWLGFVKNGSNVGKNTV